MEKLQKEKETPKVAIIIAIVLLLYVMMASCTKRVFVGDQEAIYWRVLFEQCQTEHTDCEDLLNECVELGNNLLNCP